MSSKPTKKKTSAPELRAVPSPATAPASPRHEANLRALQQLEATRHAAGGVDAIDHADALSLLASASGTCESDLVAGLLQEVRHTLGFIGTALQMLDLCTEATPLLDDDECTNAFASMQRKLRVVERLYLLQKVRPDARQVGADLEVGA